MKDSQTQQATGIFVNKGKIEIVLYQSYTGIIPSNVDQQVITDQLLNRKFGIVERTHDSLKIKTEGGVIISLYHSCGKKWQKVGTFTDIDSILQKYPSTQYQYGSQNLCRPLIQNINVTKWNRGTRIYFPLMLPHGDNPKSFHKGTSMYTRGTDDEESKTSTKFTHRYVDSELKECCSHVVKDQQLTVYVRRFH